MLLRLLMYCCSLNEWHQIKGFVLRCLYFAGTKTSMTNRQLFLNHVGQTSKAPLALEIIKAEGCKLFDADGKTYIDLIGGISVCNIGHRHPKVIEAIKKQLDDYLHIMVYGELVQSPQVRYAKMLVDRKSVV